MDPNRLSSVSVTPTVGRQTPRNEFGEVLRGTLQGAVRAGGALIGSLPGGAVVSAAVSSVTAFANQGTASAARAQTAVVGGVGGANAPINTVAQGETGNPLPTGFDDMLRTMRAEADRSILMQMRMQEESREYNALTNVLKVRHDSAKAAINNVR